MDKRTSRCIGNESCSVRWINGKVGPLCPFHDEVEGALQAVARWRKLSHTRAWPVLQLEPERPITPGIAALAAALENR